MYPGFYQICRFVCQTVIQSLVILAGDKLYNNDEVLSVIRMSVDHNINFYLYNNEIIVLWTNCIRR